MGVFDKFLDIMKLNDEMMIMMMMNSMMMTKNSTMMIMIRNRGVIHCSEGKIPKKRILTTSIWKRISLQDVLL